MHQQPIEHGRCYMQNNQLLAKSPVELMDNSIIKVFIYTEISQSRQPQYSEDHLC